MFTHSDPRARTAANLDFKKRCAEAKVLPYFVPVGGFMLTPRYDDDPELLGAAIKEMASCALATAREMGWSKSALLPLDGPPPSAPKPVERLLQADMGASPPMTRNQRSASQQALDAPAQQLELFSINGRPMCRVPLSFLRIGYTFIFLITPKPMKTCVFFRF